MKTPLPPPPSFLRRPAQIPESELSLESIRPPERKSFDAALAALEAALDPPPQFLASPRPEYLRALPSVPPDIAEIFARY